MRKELPENLRKLRVEANYSQEYIADTIGISLSTYSRFERGETAIDLESIVKLSTLYKLTLDEIYHYGDPDFKVSEPRLSYIKKWTVPITVGLDGTEETLQMWLQKLTAINSTI